MIDEAIAFAATAHAKQKRKYDDLPYIVHPIEVMSLVHLHAANPTPEMLVAAVLHDVVEDTPVGLKTIERRFGPTVAAYVDGLTDKFTSPDEGNRKQRKRKERERLAGACFEVQTIKYADLISNTGSIVKHDKNFARVYLREKEELLLSMRGGDKVLFQMANESLMQAFFQL